ncbi:BamA/TamA family outer membrane protein [Flavicella sp.]|uniref:translocation and assembly module lipoprotein TamL n=1 Tax=Flavicella sp. TaxID=2957742 RepID=UPI003016C17E
MNFNISFLYYIGILLVFNACKATKYVPEGQFLLSKNKIHIDDKNKTDNEVKDYIIQRPNSTFLGIPFSLHFYNRGNIAYEQFHDNFFENNPKTINTFNKIFSEKQTVRIGESYKNLNRWFLMGGQAPVILNEIKAAQTTEKLRTYYFNNGYFNAEVDYDIHLKIKKADINYNIVKNTPFRLDSIRTIIDSQTLDSIYQNTKSNSFLKSGDIYKDMNFRNEADRLTRTFRNAGIYHFSQNQIGFYDIDNVATNHKTDVILKITNRLIENEGIIETKPLNIQKITKIGIFTDYSYDRINESFKDTTVYNGFHFYSHDKLKYHPKALLNAIFIEPGDIYKDSTRSLTRKHLKLLKNFKMVKIKYSEINDKELAATIILTPMKKYSISMNTEVIHSNIKQLGFAGGFSFINRNSFRNAEIFKLTFKGSIFDVAKNVGDTNDKSFSSWELSADASIEVPRIVFPFGSSSIIDKKMAPKTLFSIGSSFQKNIGLDKQKFTTFIEYSWTPNKRTKHIIEPINGQYVKNLNKDQYFYIYSSEYSDLTTIQEEYFPDYALTEDNALQFVDDNIDQEFQATDPDAYQEVKNIEKRNEIITTDYVIPAITYSFTYSSQTDFKDENYVFFRAKIANVGSLMSALTKNEIDGVKTFADTPIAQYTKTDFEFIKYWGLPKSNVLVFRTFAGIAVPYGNSDDIPFTSSYFIGGSSDIRAYKTYELGPGSNNSGLEFNVGSLKLIANLEYRFGITKSIKGALFIDAGNIWDITDSELSQSDEKFTGLASLKNSAIGTGFGIRYDFSFFIFRMDLGFKTYEPNIEGDRWFKNYDLDSSVINIGINYPF